MLPRPAKLRQPEDRQCGAPVGAKYGLKRRGDSLLARPEISMTVESTTIRQTRWAVALNRIPVRLVLLFVALAALDLACQILGSLVVHKAPGPLRDAARLGSALFLSAAMIAAYRWLIRVTEQRGAEELGTRMAASGLASGIAAGAGLFALVYAVLWTLGAARLQGFGELTGLSAALSVAIASAVGEEIVFRGVVFRLLEDALGTTVALMLSASMFGLVHAGNHGATWASTLAIALESGALMGVAYVLTRTLWLPIGLHFGWNFTEGGIFGAAVSGGNYTGVIVAPLSGTPMLTGGAFGPEASVVAMAVSLIASIVLAWFAIREDRWRRWRGISS